MASSSASPTPGTAAGNSKKGLGFLSHAVKRKDSFIQFFAMTGILLLSMRSLGQKYKIHNLEEDIHVLRDENASLSDRIKNIKRDLLREASLDSSGLFASRLRRLFSAE
ncbi:hypothetical protein LR48_Vigan09g036300 [Vigna angularis]|uniref:Uncharacterized protein n=2 Tax=Phaseolus angularis TaxID=3914 RepID=A0A0L9VAL4_PHAAN|nr:uncharacterized protein LOC108342272 [Vigna angularis]KAG2400749.1 uncharacterized protein HKW66_Vig0093970 [Vigna angularis]KOM51704.1 hypothetical protein LR48_Vigan09g036300 [Vigna angularis]BAT77639.1 hypothetical protein VIGAN_02022800 [Vigna angularis var. angularis]